MIRVITSSKGIDKGIILILMKLHFMLIYSKQLYSTFTFETINKNIIFVVNNLFIVVYKLLTST